MALTVDAAICVFTVWFAFFLRLGNFVALSDNALWAAVASIALAIPIFIVSGLYRAIFRYSGWPALLAVVRAVAIYGLFYSTIFTAISLPDVPRTVGLIQPILLLLFVGGSRVLARFWLGGHYNTILKHASRPKVLIYGAGSTGRELATAMTNSPEMQVIGFLDDDPSLHRRLLNGLPVHNPADLAPLARKWNVAHVLLAMPNISRNRRNEILVSLSEHQISVRTLPSLIDLAQGRVTVSDVRELEVDDLLGRDPVTPDAALLGELVANRVVLVTGAGGSIGSELCRQIIRMSPKKLLLVDQSEYALYAIHQELERKCAANQIPVVPLLASVTDAKRMQKIMKTLRPETVYHAAAYKHVPLVEHNPGEGIRNNVFGTLHTAQAAAASGVQNFVLISTDKAVRPTNLMGASKRLAEMVLQALADAGAPTTFSMVRFGNVLGSSGSVVPKFRQQIREGGPITLTHPEITRYFMTVPEAAQLVIQAGAMAEGGDVFVLDMGQPVRIFDLARKMVELSGLTLRDEAHPDGDVEIKITGLRPGEKLYEELLIGDNPRPTSHERILKAQEAFTSWGELEPKLQILKRLTAENDVSAIQRRVQELVPEYVSNGEIVDWIHTGEIAVE
ncbi:polysaccharide biosynthesis protein [Rhizobium sp. C4]|uniref:polysaccharide biosynthesis protein n=1 Tax=Rhizobium sp. C4 TaxID=1349800 RepID=UPI001E5E0F19|nr:nucleoside-diphosphate sugar epimerase/dehydratase [Rhizobium sp. C4]MCD2176177.1 polysaccharide biosynthesis protein [Rhizobium sp. C4]